MTLHHTRLVQDPRYLEAKKLLLQALHDAQKGINGVQSADNLLKEDYSALLEAYHKIRGFPLYYPYIGSGIGNGVLVELLDGSIKYDMISGIGACYFGHSNPDIAMEALDAAMTNCVMQGNLQQNKDSFELSALLCAISGFDHCFLTTSGAMACENCLKIAFQKKHPASRILAFENGFSGRTCLLTQVSDKPVNREGLPVAYQVDYVPFFDYRQPDESIERAVCVLKTHLVRYPHQHAVMCMELVQGEGGFWVGSKEFFKKIIAVLKEHGIVVWVDEVQTFLRTDSYFAFQHFDLTGLVDVVTIGKALQACATLFTCDLLPRPGLLSQTFTASTAAIRVGKYIVEGAIKNHFFGPDGRIMQQHTAFAAHFQQLSDRYGPQVIQGPYGIGGMLACTLFEGDFKKTKEFLLKLYENGVIAFIAGKSPARIRFLPPIGGMEFAHIEPIMAIFEKTLREFV